MLARLALMLLMLLPVAEIALLVWIVGKFGFFVALALVIGAGVVGAALARYQGVQCLERVSADMRRGQMPAEPMFDAMLILLAALLMIIPGLLTDVVGILLLFPPTRRSLKHLMRKRFQSRIMVVHGRSPFAGDQHDQIIDVKVVETPERIAE